MEATCRFCATVVEADNETELAEALTEHYFSKHKDVVFKPSKIHHADQVQGPERGDR